MKENIIKTNPELKSDVRIEIIKDGNIEGSLASEVAESYARVFAGPPWNEVARCPKCSKFSPEMGVCGACGGGLERAYPLISTSEYIRSLLAKPNSLMVLARDTEGKIVGWSIGYKVNLMKLLREKYPDEKSYWKVWAALNAVGASGDIYYFAEAGIETEWRGQGIIDKLYAPRLEIAKSLNLQAIIRTNVRTPINRVAQRLGFTQVLGPKANLDDLNSPQGEIIRTLDPRNPERVWYFRRNEYRPGVYGGRSDMPSDSNW